MTVDGQFVHKRTILSFHCYLKDSTLVSSLPILIPNQRYPTNRASVHPLGVDCLRGLGCLGQPWHLFWVLPQGPLVGPWECFPSRFQPKYDCILFYHLSHEFHPKQTCKTKQNMLTHIRSFQGMSFKRHGRSWTFGLQNSRNLTHFLYMI